MRKLLLLLYMLVKLKFLPPPQKKNEFIFGHFVQLADSMEFFYFHGGVGRILPSAHFVTRLNAAPHRIDVISWRSESIS